jgi:hypothetical protein
LLATPASPGAIGAADAGVSVIAGALVEKIEPGSPLAGRNETNATSAIADASARDNQVRR